MRKKFTAMLLICLCMLSLCGCANVSYSDIIFDDGSIMQQIVVTLDEEKITSAGMTLNEVQTDTGTYAWSCYNNLLMSFNSSVTDLQTKLLVQQNHKFEAVKQANKVVIQLKFNNLSIYKYFYFHELTESSGGIVTDHGFYEKDTTTTHTEFHDLANNSIAKFWLNYFAEKMPNVTLNNCTYTYTYSTPYEKIYSNADQIAYDDYGNVSHTWDYTSKDLTGENAQTGDIISLYTIAIKSPLWYFVAIGATAILIVVLYIVCAVKDSKKKKAILNNGETTSIEIK